jgi:hypothetical protein
MFIAAFFLLFNSIFVAQATPRTGPYSVQPYAAVPSMKFTYSFFGEGIEYDVKQDRVLLGSLGERNRHIYSVPYFNGITPTTYDLADMKLVWNGTAGSGSSDLPPSVAGLEIDPIDPDIVCAVLNSFPPKSGDDCGVAKVNFRTGVMETYYSFKSLASSYNGNKCMTNDIVLDSKGKNAYLTDFYGYQIIQLETVTGTSSVLDDSFRSNCLCDTSVTSCPPDINNLYPLNGPNGIEIMDAGDSALLIGISSTKLCRYTFASKEMRQVNVLTQKEVFLILTQKSPLYMLRVMEQKVRLLPLHPRMVGLLPVQRPHTLPAASKTDLLPLRLLEMTF